MRVACPVLWFLIWTIGPAMAIGAWQMAFLLMCSMTTFACMSMLSDSNAHARRLWMAGLLVAGGCTAWQTYVLIYE